MVTHGNCIYLCLLHRNRRHCSGIENDVCIMICGEAGQHISQDKAVQSSKWWIVRSDVYYTLEECVQMLHIQPTKIPITIVISQIKLSLVWL